MYAKFIYRVMTSVVEYVEPFSEMIEYPYLMIPLLFASINK